MSIEKYDKLYSISAEEFVLRSDVLEENFVFQGSKNWDMYMSKKPQFEDFSTFEKVKLLDFYDKKEFDDYLVNNSIIDYSLEHIHDLNRYFILADNG